MSLLTEKQIKEILLIIENEVNVKWSDTMLLEMLFEWNKIQTSTQIEPDWTKASDNAVSAVVHVTWVDKLGIWIGSHPVVIFERPASVITPHPHAEILAKYAEVAARRVDPWVEFEFKCYGQGWTKSTILISFYEDFEYRYIGDNK